MNRYAKTLASVAALGSLALVVLLAGSGPTETRADDASRTTSLQVTGATITATLNSTNLADETWTITWYHTPSGQSEYQHCSTATSRTMGITSQDNLSAFLYTGDYQSGDTVRAHFQTFDNFGQQLFSFSRFITVP